MGLWRQFKTPAVFWPDRGKMPPVRRKEPGEFQAFRYSHNGGVDETDIQIKVVRQEIQAPGKIVEADRLDDQLTVPDG